MNKNLIIIMLGIIILSSHVWAIGITPGRTTIDYQPGTQKQVDFTVVNSESKDVEIVILIQGELNGSITVSEASFSMSASEGSKTVSYLLDIPTGLTPGLHTAEVIALALPGKTSKSEAFVGAAVGVATQVHIFVPYPGKYAEANLDIVGPESDGKITFVVPVLSRGNLDLVRVGAIIDIYTPLNQKIATINTEEVSILSGERKELAVTWDSNSVAPGPYRAVATIIYDESTSRVEKQFTVGQRVLELQGIEVNDFSLGEIAKFEILVENQWSETISDVYAQMLIYNSNKEVIADFKSQTYEISSLEKALMVAFWDTEGVRSGVYDSSIFLRYGEKSSQQDFKLEVSDNEINVIGVGYVISRDDEGGSGNTLTIILISAVVLLILINLLWFLVLRKKLKK